MAIIRNLDYKKCGKIDMQSIEFYNPKYPDAMYYFNDESWNYKAHKGVLYRKPRKPG